VTNLLKHQLKVEEKEKEYNPTQTASIFSFLFYSYLSPLVWKAYRKPALETSDLSPPLAEEKADYLLEEAIPVSFLVSFSNPD
jgi:hypothetical protein